MAHWNMILQVSVTCINDFDGYNSCFYYVYMSNIYFYKMWSVYVGTCNDFDTEVHEKKASF